MADSKDWIVRFYASHDDIPEGHHDGEIVRELIRCKDCVWWDRLDDSPIGYCHACKHGYYSDKWEISIRRTYKEDFYCADGERETDDA